MVYLLTEYMIYLNLGRNQVDLDYAALSFSNLDLSTFAFA